MNDKLAIYIELEAIYKRIPEVQCRRKCQQACGPILMSAVEWQRIREQHYVGPLEDDLTCPLLANGDCAVYSIRPAICRIWGATKRLRCPHGCVPTRWLTDEESLHIIKRLIKLSGDREPVGPGTEVFTVLERSV